MSSAKKIDANRANACRSTGPKTPTGKNNSRRNAIKHGFYSSELILSDAEKVEFQALDRTVHAQYQPKTVLQNMGLDDVVYCRWRCKSATRQETRQLRSLFETSNDDCVQAEGTVGPSTTARWYAASRQDLRSATRWLKDVKDDFEANGQVREDWKEDMDSIFGNSFYQSLTKWTPMSRDAILAATHMALRRKTFGKAKAIPDGTELSKVVIDPNQGHEMIGKLIGQELRHLEHLYRSWDQVVCESVRAQTAAVQNFAPRYFTTAMRDFRRAVEWYLYLQKNNL